MTTPEVLFEGLSFGEGPRWHDGRLWVSDFYTHRVLAIADDGTAETIVEVPNRPSGLGWLPDGRLLVVSMTDRRLLRLDGATLVEHADLSAVASGDCNDMVVDASGRAYVGNFGYDFAHRGTPKAATLALVGPDGAVSAAASDLQFPNGTVITPDGATLVLGETFGRRLTAFDIAPDGSLSNRREWADLGNVTPDGICLDEEGGIWVADPTNSQCVRVLEGGQVTDRIPTERGCFACMLGGPDRRTLHLVTGELTSEFDRLAVDRPGRVETVRVEVPGAGWP
ncbi:MAG TPA: SMP-30/gluconolactonase/LRE family protein [Acidimicrobiales bacterium]|nr:SMP-30/gluconolactonase/LRE family protein [Acidimicrobiales bacterium]